MFFPLSKVIYFLITPSNLFIFLVLIGLVLLAATRLRRTGMGLALLGAIGLMLSTDPHDVEHALHSVEWDTLLFFATLFVMVEGMAELGMIRAIAEA